MPKLRENLVMRRLKAGATLQLTHEGHEEVWTYPDTGKRARADVCERLMKDGKLAPRGDGLFPETSQTFELAP